MFLLYESFFYIYNLYFMEIIIILLFRDLHYYGHQYFIINFLISSYVIITCHLNEMLYDQKIHNYFIIFKYLLIFLI